MKAINKCREFIELINGKKKRKLKQKIEDQLNSLKSPFHVEPEICLSDYKTLQSFMKNRCYPSINILLSTIKKQYNEKQYNCFFEDAIQYAVELGDFDIVKHLVDLNPAYNPISFDTLRIAAGNGYLTILKYLIPLYQNAFDCKYIYNTIIIIGASKGYLGVVKYAVSLEGADIHDNNNEALREAATEGNLETVKYLVSLGADVKAINGESLCNALENKHLGVAQYLIEQGGYVKRDDDKALQLAINCHHDLFTRLLDEHSSNEPFNNADAIIHVAKQREDEMVWTEMKKRNLI